MISYGKWSRATGSSRSIQPNSEWKISPTGTISEKDALVELATRKAREFLIPFTCLTYPAYDPSWHHQIIADALEKVERGEIHRLMILAPPRHGKSEIISIRFPVWYMGRHPDRMVMSTSYGADLAVDFGRKARNLAIDPIVTQIFPKFKLDPDSAAADHWNTTEKGAYIAQGVGGALTGHGAHCLPQGTLIQTPAGLKQIQSLRPGNYVLSYSQSQGIKHAKIKAILSREEGWLYRIRTANGRILESTGDHKIFANGRFIQASELAKGQAVLCILPKRVYKAGMCIFQVAKEWQQRSLLFPGLFQIPSGSEKQAALHKMQLPSGEENEEILRRLQVAASRSQTYVSVSRKALSDMWPVLFSGMERDEIRYVLHEALCRDRPFKSHVRYRQPDVQAWSESTENPASWRESIQTYERADTGKRWPNLHRLQNPRSNRQAAYPSHRRLAHEQFGIQPSGPMRVLPQEMAFREEFETIEDFVAVVERVRKETRVYDIQVETDECFFANGILVHNCLIIDDPYKNREEAMSASHRAKVWDWWQWVAYPRLAPQGAVVVITGRWHKHDFAGQLLEQAKETGEEWTVISLPAIAEKDEEYRRQGQALWPQRYGIDRLNQIKSVVGSQAFNALFQQRPSEVEGNIIRRGWWKYYQALPSYFDQLIQSWDMAFKQTDDSSYVVGQVWARRGADKYLLDQVRARMDFVGTIKAVKSLSGKWPKAVGKLVEDKANGPAVVSALKHEVSGLIEVTPEGGKEARASAVAPEIEAGNVYLPEPSQSPWVHDFIEECSDFPNGANDDQVDAMSQALHHWVGAGQAFAKTFALAGDLESAKGW